MGMADLPANLGLAGWVISGLAGAVVTLAGAIALQWKNGNDTNKARITEASTHSASLQKALIDTHTALHEIIETSKRRNEVTEKLTALIAEQGIGFRLFTEQFKHQQETVNSDLETAIDAVKSLAESLRVLADETRSVNLKVSAVQGGIEAILRSRP